VADRKNQSALSAAEWTRLLNAIDRIQTVQVPAPRYRDFVRVHVAAMSPLGSSWGVHSMPWMGMPGPNFLAWHRLYLYLLERRLQRAANDPTLGVPYWDWIADPVLPPQLNTAAQLNKWGVTRRWNQNVLPRATDLAAATARSDFPSFQSTLEGVHGLVHQAVGGVAPPLATMATSSSPADPIFWFHHSNVDRIWAQWQASPQGEAPPNQNYVLQPSTGFAVRWGRRVSFVLDLTGLGYRYV
jgi:tyrosinase